MTIRAPVDGRVLQLVAAPGTRLMASPGHTATHDGSTVVTLYQPEKLQVRADVRFEDLPKVRLPQRALIASPAVSSPLEGSVLFISSVADIQKNTLQVKVGIDAPPPVLKPDMLVELTFLASKSSAAGSADSGRLSVYVPKSLIEQETQGSFVWVADQSAGIARRISVETGAAGPGGLIEVTRGLTPATRLIVSGRDGLRDGERIRIAEEAPSQE
jgi:multidrug efflux pump subunit AcrA (membrane-fusion protein)